MVFIKCLNWFVRLSDSTLPMKHKFNTLLSRVRSKTRSLFLIFRYKTLTRDKAINLDNNKKAANYLPMKKCIRCNHMKGCSLTDNSIYS